MTAGNSDAGPPTFSLEDLMEYRHTQPFEGTQDLSNNRVNVFYVNIQYRVTRKVTGWDKEPFGQFCRTEKSALAHWCKGALGGGVPINQKMYQGRKHENRDCT